MVDRAQLPRKKVSVEDQDFTGTVTVACKHPNGIILEEFFRTTESQIGPGDTTKNVPVYRRGTNKFTVRGNRVPFGVIPEYQIVCGYALTPGIPKKFWENWLEFNKDSDVVKNSIIFAYDDMASVMAAAKENEKRKSGLEPLDPLNLPVKGIETMNKD